MQEDGAAGTVSVGPEPSNLSSRLSPNYIIRTIPTPLTSMISTCFFAVRRSELYLLDRCALSDSLLETTLGSGPNSDEAAQQLEIVAERQLPWPANIARFLTKLDFPNPTTSVPEALQGTAA